MPRGRGRRTKFQEKLARERIEKLFSFLHYNRRSTIINPDKCVKLVKLISKRYNQRLSSKDKSKFCRKCDSVFTASNVRFRISNKGWRTVTCLSCGEIYRFRI